ncbi:hypothetical protein N9P29_00760 [bacterium]|nr:hypothetical protein [bacterium]
MSAYNTNDTDPTMSAIRTILHEPAPAMDEAKARVTGILTTKRKAPAEKQVNAPKVESDQSRISAVMGRKKWAVTPKRKYAYWAVFALIVVVRPFWIVIPFVIAILALLVSFAIFGSNKTWGAIIKAFQSFAPRLSERLQSLAVRLDAFTMRWHGLLDRLPGGRVDALYLPDFQSLQVSEDQHQEVVGDRLSRMQASG